MTPPPHDIELLLREREWLARLTRRLLGEGPDADDLAQETITRAMGHAGAPGAGSPPSAMRGWLATIARNLTLEGRRAGARRRAREEASARPEASGNPGGPGDPEAHDRMLLRRELIDEVLRLAEPERSAVVLHYFEGLPYDAVAERLGINAATARKRVSRAISRLRGKLQSGEHGLTAFAPLLLPLRALETHPIEVATSTTLTLSTEILLMSVQAKLAIGAVVLLAIGLPLVVLYESADSRVPANGGAVEATGAAADIKLAPAMDGAQSQLDATRIALVGEDAASAQESWTHEFSGRVVDETRHPVAGAEVRIGWSNDGEFVTTDEDGSFRLLASLPVPAAGTFPQVAVVARAGPDRTAVSWHRYMSGESDDVREVDIGTLVLSPGHLLTVRVVADGGPVPGAEIEVSLTHERSPVGQQVTDERGLVTLLGIPRGVVVLSARHGESAVLETFFVPDRADVVLTLGPAHSVDVLVVDAETGAPVVGAALSVDMLLSVPAEFPGLGARQMSIREFNTTRRLPEFRQVTGENGRAHIGGMIGSERYRLHVTADGFLTPESDARLEDVDGEIRVELNSTRGHTVRWKIVPGEVPVPADGAVVELSPVPGSRRAYEFARGFEKGRGSPEARIEGGELVASGVTERPFFDVRTDAGTIARARAREGENVGPEISFRRARKIEITVTDADGTPVEGAGVTARNQGNFPLCHSQLTDASGRAVIEGLYGGRAEVRVKPPTGSDLMEAIAGTVDLDAGDAQLWATLETRVTRTVRLRLLIAGVPRLPARYKLRGWGRIEVVEEDPDRGELVAEVVGAHAGELFKAHFSASGYAPVSVEVKFQSDTDEPVVTVELDPVTFLVAEVAMPAEGRVELSVQRRAEGSGKWGPIGLSVGLRKPNGPDGTFVFAGIGPGQWRVFDKVSKLASTVASITRGMGEARVVLDLDASAWVEGIVEVDDPADLGRVEVRVLDGTVSAPSFDLLGLSTPSGARLQNGSFRVRVPGDQEVTVVAWHPWLTPDPQKGSITLTGGRDAVVLRLVAGDQLRLPVPQLEARPRQYVQQRTRIARYDASVTAEGLAGAPIEWHYAPVVDGVLRCALPKGRWTLLLDVDEEFAPFIMEAVEIDGVTELAPATLDVGSILSINLAVPDGQDAPRIYAFVERLDPPIYRRSLNSRGESRVEVRGLGPGRFRVRYGAVMDHNSSGQEQEFTADGTHGIEIDFDRR